MATNLALDEELIAEALRLGKHRSKRETVDAALREYVVRRRQRDLLDLAGKVDWDTDYDYKAQRARP